VIIDAGPALNFLASNNERLLLEVVGGYLSAPESVSREVLSKSASDPRFAPAARVWAKLERARRVTVLSDGITPELEAVIGRPAKVAFAPRRSPPAAPGRAQAMRRPGPNRRTRR
jgi:hypothetical protein